MPAMNESVTDREQGELLASRFRLIRRLGAGGLSEVWLAEEVGSEDVGARERLAVKILADAHARRPALVDHFRREFAVAQSLVHPGIVRPLDFHSGEGRHFFTMPALPGGHIGERREESWSEAMRRLLPVCDALAYAHRKGVVHGDIKPHNILLDESGTARLTDFGAARLPDADPDPRIAKAGGSLACMSPQQREGHPAQISDDIYALGCVAYELLCGFPPYAPDISEERIQAGQAASPAAPAAPEGLPRLPEALVKLVMAMLARDSVRRPATVQAIRAGLEEILQESAAEREPAETADPAADAAPAAIVARARAADGIPAPVLPRRSGVPVWLAYALGGLLLVVASVLFVVLPRIAEERAQSRPPAAQRIVPQSEEAPRQDLRLMRMQRDAADEAMGEMLQDRNYLANLQPSLWSGGLWEQALDEERKGDDFYRGREYTQAQSAYGSAGGKMRELREQAPEIGRNALQAAQQAIELGDQADAMAELEKAGILLGEAEPEVQLARRRAEKLPQIMEAVAEARAAERNGSLEEQRAAWRAVLAMDPDRDSARSALAAVNAGIERQLFTSRMSRGHAALAEGNVEAARAAFEAAKKQRPNASAPVEALAALELEERGQSLAQLQASAMAGQFAENWRKAAESYRAMLDIDSNIVAAQQGLAEAQQRVRLDDNLENTIANAQGLNRDDAWQRGKRLLEDAGGVASPGPRLRGQIDRLEQALRVAATPAPVQLRSDGLTEVTIYHVGRLGSFDNRVLQLRPGAYTAVGTRDGYRDVRREFVVAPEGLSDPLVLVCTDPI